MEDNQKYHWFLICGIEGNYEGNHITTLQIAEPTRNVTNKKLEEWKQILIQETNKNGSKATNKMMVTGASYLGEMTKVEFFGEENGS
ncbi:hypothetical protein [Acinetobacter nosocomialis]|uniref:hypothetical protein n=1 Tax=Acinetobacter nosocomialis TaxID=106654 RepID=UPI0033ACF4D8